VFSDVVEPVTTFGASINADADKLRAAGKFNHLLEVVAQAPPHCGAV
jgi:hypothetical protein